MSRRGQCWNRGTGGGEERSRGGACDGQADGEAVGGASGGDVAHHACRGVRHRHHDRWPAVTQAVGPARPTDGCRSHMWGRPADRRLLSSKFLKTSSLAPDVVTEAHSSHPALIEQDTYRG